MFPLVPMGYDTSPILGPVLAKLADAGLLASRHPVDYEFQRGGDTMLRLRVAPDRPLWT
ncbi:hypothetical protein EV193_103374 [Herbihabitans rhizosphaerae]|uniref:Uncharacterized protein n=1 Tax=Herbihabitans rhizosphaerae TaxID=1872711 RepID=A0A4Q7KWT3_9PSEU|nr:hypothetical protein [Herbihabitans rhizosphaerae]RZS41056.1 hypothetical protein EV193_103374 [Herbihabitans rhizosphaerae]